MKFKLVLPALVSLALLATSTASAYIAAVPGTSTSLTQCFVGSHSVTIVQGGYLRFGWGTVSQQQSLDFLAAQNFTLKATGTNTAPKFTTGEFTVASWATGNTDNWTAPVLVTEQNTVNGNKPFYRTNAYIQVNLAPGDYTLSTLGTSVNRAVFDGQFVTKKNENWYPITGCTLIVT
jgi:hypothetical protein